jgi:hypothetical protein
MMNTNPALGIGYLIGNAMGENYWGKKRAKTEQDADKKFWDDYMAKHGIGANENGVYGVNNNGAVNDLGRSVGSMSPMERRAQIMTDMRDYLKSQGKTSGTVRPSEVAEWKARNNILNNMGNNNAPRTPQQNNTSGVTVGNVDNGGGVSSVADGWNRMANGSGYNPGNTTMFTNGTRDLGNVIGADANGEFGRMAGLHPGVIIDTARGIYPAARPGTYIDTSRGIYMDSSQNTPSAAPQATTLAGPGYGDVLGLKKDGVYFPMNRPNPAPIPYTAEQLQQIQNYGGFTPEELQRMGAGELVAPAAQAPAQGGGILTSAAERYAPATPTAPQQPANIDKIIAGDDEIYERGNPFAGQSTPLPVSHRGTRAMAAAWQQDPNIMNVASSTPVAPPQLVYPNDVDEKYYLELLANAQHGD